MIDKSLIEKFKHDKDTHAAIFENEIKRRAIGDATPVQQPKVVIVAAQPGAGKSALFKQGGVIAQEFKDNNFVHVDTDELRGHHGQHDEILLHDDKLYGELTQHDAGLWRDDLIDACSKEKQQYNIVLETTFGEPEQSAEMCNRLKDRGFEVVVVSKATHERESTLRMYKRYEEDKADPDKGFGRLPPQEYADKCYKALPESLKRVQDSKSADRILILNDAGHLIQESKPTGREWTTPDVDLLLEQQRAKGLRPIEQCRADWQKVRQMMEDRGAPEHDIAVAMKISERWDLQQPELQKPADRTNDPTDQPSHASQTSHAPQTTASSPTPDWALDTVATTTFTQSPIDNQTQKSTDVQVAAEPTGQRQASDLGKSQAAIDNPDWTQQPQSLDISQVNTDTNAAAIANVDATVNPNSTSSAADWIQQTQTDISQTTNSSMVASNADATTNASASSSVADWVHQSQTDISQANSNVFVNSDAAATANANPAPTANSNQPADANSNLDPTASSTANATTNSTPDPATPASAATSNTNSSADSNANALNSTPDPNTGSTATANSNPHATPDPAAAADIKTDTASSSIAQQDNDLNDKKMESNSQNKSTQQDQTTQIDDAPQGETYERLS